MSNHIINQKQLEIFFEREDLTDILINTLISNIAQSLTDLDIDNIDDLFSDNPEKIRKVILGKTDTEFFEQFNIKIQIKL